MSSFTDQGPDGFQVQSVRCEQLIALGGATPLRCDSIPSALPAFRIDHLTQTNGQSENKSWMDILCFCFSPSEWNRVYNHLPPDDHHIVISSYNGFALVAVWGLVKEHLSSHQLQMTCGQLYETLSDDAKHHYEVNASRGIARRAFLGDWYRKQHGKRASWIESPLLAHDILVLQSAHAEEVARKLVFMGLYVSADDISERFLQNSPHKDIIGRISRSLQYYSSAEDGLQVVALLRQVIWPTEQSYVQPSCNRTPLKNLYLLAESIGVSETRHPIWLSPKTFYQKLGSSLVFQGHMEKASEIRHSLENTGIVLPLLESQVAWHLPINQATEFRRLAPTMSCPGEYMPLLSVFSIYYNRYLPPEVISLLEDPNELAWNRDQVFTPSSQTEFPHQTMTICLLGLWAHEMRTLNLENICLSDEYYNEQDILEHFCDLLKDMGRKDIRIGILARMIQGLDMVLHSQESQSQLASLTERAVHLSKKFLPSEPDPRAACYWVIRLKRPDLNHGNAASYIQDEFRRKKEVL